MADEPILVGTPDGQRFQFPAGTDHLTMKRAIDEHYRSTAVGQGGAPSLPADSTKTPDKWSPEAMMRDDRSITSMIPGADWLRTGAINAVANASDALTVSNPLSIASTAANVFAPAGTSGPSPGATIRNLAHKQAGAPIVNTPEEYGGKVTDAVRDAVVGSVMMPGSFIRNIVPAAVGGGASELAGQATAGSSWEIPARIGAGLVGGAGAATAQTVAGAVRRGVQNANIPVVRNVVGGNNVDETAARIVGRAADNDKLTPQQMLARMKDLGDEATLADAGGENVRGALRGSIAAPGPARTTVRNAFNDRADNEGARVGASIDKNVSPKGLTQTVDDLIEARRKASAPAYVAAGVPNDPKAYATAPALQGDAVTSLIRDSKDVQAAIAAARRLPDYKNLPDTSMVMLDKAYKQIGGMADEAKRAGNGERFRDLDSLRKSLAGAIGEENPNYSAALTAYSEPSKIKDAAELGAKLFSSNARPDVVRREFAALSPDGQEAFRVGVAEQLRKVAGARDSTNVAGRVMGGPDAQARLTAVLGKEEADAIMADLAREKTFTRTARDVGQGSRTTPMALEASDNAGAAGGVLGDVARGRFTNALSRVAGRVTEGRTEAVNARVAEILTSMKPEDRTAFASALETALMRQRLNSPRNALGAGAGAPLPAASRRDRE